MVKWIWKLLMDQRGEDASAEGADSTNGGTVNPLAGNAIDPAAGDEGGQSGDGTPPAPKFGEFGDDPNEAAVKLFETFNKTKTDFDNFKTKAGLTEKNLGSLRKTLEASGIQAIEENGQIRLEVINKQQPEKKVRFTDEHKGMFDGKVLEAMRLLVQDVFDESYEGRERMSKEQRTKMQQFVAEKTEVEELMINYFPQLEPKFDSTGKATNPQFNQAFYDKATEVWKEQYNSNPLKQLSAAMRAAKELNLIPNMIQQAKKEGVEIGKSGKKILAPVGGSGSPASSGNRELSKAEYLALSPEKRLEYEKWETEQRNKK